MRVFVTGADGFIGSHLVEALRDRGDSVTAFCQYNSFDTYGWLQGVEGDVTCIRGDLRDTEQMVWAIEGHDLVFHLGALISVPDSYARPRSYVEVNCIGTINVLMAARAAQAKVVHTSTSEVYGSAQYTPIDEQHPINPQSPYAASKASADALVSSFAKSYDMEAVILRPFNTYGPRQSQRAIVGQIMRQVLDPWTKAVMLGSLDPGRDLTYVSDTVEAFLRISNFTGVLWNAGSGRAITIRELAQKIMLLAGQDKPIVEDPDRVRPKASEVILLRADASELNSRGWRPSVSLTEGLTRTLDWHYQTPGAARYMT